MKKALVVLVLTVSIMVVLPAQAAKKSGGHFSGVGAFIWNEIALSDARASAFAQDAKDEKLRFVIVKAYDGREWGVRGKSRQFEPQLTKGVIQAFRKKGIRVYGYGTAYLNPQSDVDGNIENAIRTLHLGTDGIVIDDVFTYGHDSSQTEKLFKGIWGHFRQCKKCRGKAIAFSGFPHVGRQDLPWHIPARYTHFYLPQLYWETFRQTPEQTLNKFRGDWSDFKKRTKSVRSRVIPVAQAYDESKRLKVTPGDINQFFGIARTQYPGVAFYRWDSPTDKNWKMIWNWARNWHKPVPKKIKKKETRVLQRRAQITETGVTLLHRSLFYFPNPPSKKLPGRLCILSKN